MKEKATLRAGEDLRISPESLLTRIYDTCAKATLEEPRPLSQVVDLDQLMIHTADKNQIIGKVEFAKRICEQIERWFPELADDTRRR
jgi:hypothetical protein